MSTKKAVFIVCGLLLLAALIAACGPSQPGPAGEPGPAGPAGPAGPQGEPGLAPSATDLTCTACHNDTSLISGKVNSWEASVHGSGIATAYAGGRSKCSGCHSGGGFSDRIAAGVTNPDEFTTTYPNPSRPDCRACHQIHTTYTSADWALETTAAVPLYAFEGQTFDGGMGNLCVNCHQPRRAFPAATDGLIDVNSTHWGPHHGPQSAMLLGIGGAGAVAGSPSMHYSTVENTCVTCHMGDGDNHTFDPAVVTCTACHADAKNFDINSVQTTVTGKLDALKAALTTAGLLDANGKIVVGKYPEAQAAALWNYIYITKEDKSLGVHNADYTNALLDASLAAFGQ